MAHRPDSGHIEFIRLAGHAVRVTSIRGDATDGSLKVVTITRGTRDAELLRALIEQPGIELVVPGESATQVSLSDLDVRVSGAGATQIARFAMTFSAADANEPAAAPTLEERVAALEAQVASLHDAMRKLADASRQT